MTTEDQLVALLAAGNYKEFERASAEADARLAANRARLRAPNALRDAAQWYAAHGMAIFPLAPGAKRPALPRAHPGVDCRGECGRLGHGLWDATTNVDQVRAWWAANPRHNIGYATGRQYDVLDVDGPAGFQSMGILRENERLPPIVGKVWTPGDSRTGRHRGLHLYTPATGTTNHAGIAPGLDTRGYGGYVVMPPSVINDRMYEWWVPLP